MATVVDVRNSAYMLARAMGVNLAYSDERPHIDPEPGDKYGTRYKLYQYRLRDYEAGTTLVREDTTFSGYTCGASAMVDKIRFAIRAIEAMNSEKKVL